jgi:hypothetical protein
VQSLLQNISSSAEEDVAEVMKILQAEDLALVKEPSKKLCPHFKKLRQAFYKEKYHQQKDSQQK